MFKNDPKKMHVFFHEFKGFFVLLSLFILHINDRWHFNIDEQDKFMLIWIEHEKGL